VKLYRPVGVVNTSLRPQTPEARCTNARARNKPGGHGLSFFESHKFEIWRSKNDDGTCEKWGFDTDYFVRL
jgi:hypothetical protein